MNAIVSPLLVLAIALMIGRALTVGPVRRVITRALDIHDSGIHAPTLLGTALVFVFIGLAVWAAAVPSAHFDPMAFGTGSGALIGALNSAGWFGGPRPPQS